MKQKLLSLFVTLISATSLFAYDCKIDGIYYNLNTTTMTAEVTNETGSYDAKSYSGSVIIPSSITYNSQTYSVTAIGVAAFSGCSALTSVTIPNSVTTIGSSAFYGCSGLTSPLYNTTIFAYMPKSYNGAYTIPDGIEQIIGYAFSDCRGLTSITIPNSVITIGMKAFQDCSGLTKTNYTGTVADWCKIQFNMSGAYFCESNPMYYSHNFFINNVEVKDLIIPQGIETIGNYTFFGCSGLTSATIPNSVTTIEICAFEYCSGLTSVTIGNSVTTIGDYAFASCDGLTEVTIGNSVTTIKQRSFSGCKNLTYISFPKTITSIEEGAFHECGFTSITIPFNTRHIGKHAFCSCPLKKICIPNNVTIGYRAFYRKDDPNYEYKDTVCVMFSPFVSSDLSYMKNQFEYYIYKTAYYPPMYAVPYGVSSAVSPTSFEINVDLSDIYISGRDSLSLDLMSPEKEFILQANTQNNITISNLKPNTEYNFQFFSRDKKTYQWIDGCSWNISTSPLEFKTLTPKIVSAGTAVVAAETNISDYETNVGFEWRKYDAPESMPSKSGAAILFNGMMEGKLLNLSTDAYWNVRPYYEAADGTRYYGEWITFDPSDFSYFEPTVHTYALAMSPTANNVQVRGYVMTGTDDVTEQGFEYWFKGGQKAPHRAPVATPDSVYRVTASGQVMSAVLEDLAYSSTYTCRAYAIAGGKTYYGEEVQFLTPEDPRPIYTLTVLAGENGSVNAEVSGQYREGDKITLKATPNEGYQFDQWSDGSTDNPYVFTLLQDTEITASFKEVLSGWQDIHSATTATKYFHNGNLIIERNGIRYTTTGQKLK